MKNKRVDYIRLVNVKTLIKRGLLIIGILFVLSLTIGLFSSFGYLDSFRIVFGSVYVLFLPGFILSYVFFPFSKPFDETENEFDDNKEVGKNSAIDWLERFVLSFALSIAVVPLIVFYLNLGGVRINLINVFLEIFGLIIVSLIILWYRLKKLKGK